VASDTFCVLPWVHAATLTDGSVQLCCVSGGGSGVNLNEGTLSDYWSSEYVKDARRRMLAGKKVRACERCYREEHHGVESHRIVENRVWGSKYGVEAIRNLIEETGPDGTLDAPLRYIDLRLGNACNMRCVMCQPRESSRWLPLARRLSDAAEDQELKDDLSFKSSIDASRFAWYRNAELWSDLKALLPHVQELILAGGEPFLIAEQFAFVKACCELGEADHIRLRYHTNGTVFPDEMIPYWERFEQVHFLVSIDGIGDVADYVRHPSNWDSIEDNIRRFDALGENTLTNFHFTTHALNVYRLREVLEWADRSGLRNRDRFSQLQEYVTCDLVLTPVYLDIRVLPPALKQAITARVMDYVRARPAGEASDKLTGILTFMNSQDRSARMSSLVEYTRLLDSTRDSNAIETFPELKPWLAEAALASTP
jgi:pyruvate-formate lyase-activating enzyme